MILPHFVDQSISRESRTAIFTVCRLCASTFLCQITALIYSYHLERLPPCYRLKSEEIATVSIIEIPSSRAALFVACTYDHTRAPEHRHLLEPPKPIPCPASEPSLPSHPIPSHPNELVPIRLLWPKWADHNWIEVARVYIYSSCECDLIYICVCVLGFVFECACICFNLYMLRWIKM